MAIALAASTGTVLTTIPLLPTTGSHILEVLVSLILGALAYKSPKVAVVVSAELLALSLTYQLGFLGFGSSVSNAISIPPWLGLFMLLSTILVILPMTAVRNPLGYSLGALAGALMLTPLYFMAVPLLILAGFYKLYGKATALLFFLIIYIPFQIIWFAVKSDLTRELVLYTHLGGLPFREGLGSLTFDTIAKSIFSPSETLEATSSVIAYLNGMPAIVTMASLIGAGIFTQYVTVRSLRWSIRDLSLSRLEIVLPVLATGLGTAVFLYTFQALQLPLSYRTGLDLDALGLSLLFAVLGAWALSLGEFYLSTRGLTLSLRSELSARLVKLRSFLTISLDLIKTTKQICIAIDLLNPKSSMERMRDETEGLEKMIQVSSMSSLKRGLSKVAEREKELEDTNETLRQGVLGYHMFGLEQVNVMLERLKRMGIVLETEFGKLGSLTPSPVASEGIKDLLKREGELTQEISRLVHILSRRMKDSYPKIRTIFDPNLPEADLRLNLSEGYMAQGKVREALQTIIEEVEDLQSRYNGLLFEYQQELTRLVDTMVSDDALDGSDRQALEGAKSLLGVRTVIEMDKVETATNLVFDRARSILSSHHSVLQDLEAKIISSLPTQSYEWGIESQIGGLVATIINRTKSPNISHSTEDISRLGEDLKNAFRQLSLIRSRYQLVYRMLMNYPNVEAVITRKLAGGTSVGENDLPLTIKYAEIYMKLYASHHFQEVSLRDGRLVKLVSGV